MTVSQRPRSSPPATRTFVGQLQIIGGILGLFWVLEIVDQLILQRWLDRFGIMPREVDGLWGIAAAPFLHGDFAHLASNSLPFLVLGGLILLRSHREFFLASALIALLGGLGVWLVGRGGSVHIGASGVIFGYLGYLLGLGWFERSLRAILIAVAVGFFYGGLLWGVLPSDPRISWEAHLFGFIAGLVAASVLARRPARTPAPTRRG